MNLLGTISFDHTAVVKCFTAGQSIDTEVTLLVA